VTDGFSRLYRQLDEAALDPARWPDACDALAALFGATGTLMVPQDAGARSLAMPHSRSLGEVVHSYIFKGWYRHDFRARGFPKALEAGFVVDQDLISVEEMRSHPYYNELLAPFDLKWFIGTTLKVGEKIWGVAVHGGARRGAFDSDDAVQLMKAKGPIEKAAIRTAALGFQRIGVVEDVLHAGGKGSAVLSRSGRILISNEMAEALLAGAGLLQGGRLKSRDPRIDRKLELLRDRLRTRDQAAAATGPISVSGPGGQMLSMDVIPMPRDFGAVFSGAFAFLTVQELVAPGWNDLARLMSDWQLTRREAELASHLLAGRQITQASQAMKVSVGTARQYLKSAFRKTDCGRQAELVLKLSRRG
jgi:DNA-binding CsgD family transcriptional regulator